MAGCFNVSIDKLEKGKAYRVTWLDVEANSEDYFDAEAPDFGQGEVPGSKSFPVGQKALAIGHADIDKNGMPYFILEDETGRARPVSCDVLWKEALIENPPRLLFLSSCRTGQPGLAGEAEVVSFARVMVESFQIPMVLGWGRPVQDGQASLAAEFIYRELCRGRSLPHAVQRARYELMDRFRGESAWPLLRLYARGNRPGPLVAKGQKAKPKPRALKHTYLTHSRVKVLAEGFVGRRRQLQQCVRVLKEKRHFSCMSPSSPR